MKSNSLDIDKSQNSLSWKYATNVGLILCLAVSLYSALFARTKLNSGPYIIYTGIYAICSIKTYQTIKQTKNLINMIVSVIVFIIFIVLYVCI